MATEQHFHDTAQPSLAAPSSSAPPAKRAPTVFAVLAATLFYLACVAGPVPVPRYALQLRLASVDAQRHAIQSQIDQCVANGACVKTMTDGAGTYERPAVDLARMKPGSIACLQTVCQDGKSGVALQTSPEGVVFAWAQDGDHQIGFSYSPEVRFSDTINAQHEHRAIWAQSDWEEAN